MESQELRQRLAAAKTAQAKRKRVSDGRLRREIREAFARQSARDQHVERHIRVQPDPERPEQDAQ
jgi:hypothetical protein